MVLFGSCCCAGEDDGAAQDLAAARRRRRRRRVAPSVGGQADGAPPAKAAADRAARNARPPPSRAAPAREASSSESETASDSAGEDAPPRRCSRTAPDPVEDLRQRLAAALRAVDDDGNMVTALDGLEQAKGVLETFGRPELQMRVGGAIKDFLFHRADQELYVSACSAGRVAFAEADEATNADIVFRLAGSHTYDAARKVNCLKIEEELAGVLKIQEFFGFVRNVNAIAGSAKDPVHEDDLLEALQRALPKLSSLLGGLMEEDSGDIWVERDERTGAAHIRIEAVADVAKVQQSNYASVAETLRRAHSVDLRFMQLPPGASGLGADDLRAAVQDKALNDFRAGLMFRVMSAAGYGSPDGRERRGKARHNSLLRFDFCIEADGHDLVWMDPLTCLPAVDTEGRPVRVNLAENDPGFSGRCLIGFELTAGVSELGCATISLPKIIACLDYAAEATPDHSGVAARVECTPLFIDWNRFIRFVARPVIDLDKLERLLMSEFSFKLRVGPQGATLQDTMARRGVMPGFGHFPDVPADVDPWTMQLSISATLARPASVVLAFVRAYITSQVDDFGELLLLRDIVVAFASDLRTLCAV